MRLDPGTRVGDWLVEAPLGAGGMGTVFRARNALTDRIVAALKVVDAGEPEIRERFVREVEALEHLQHPAVVRVKGWGESPHGLWLAMDLVEGEDLSTRLARGPLSDREARRLFGDLANGLAHAHARGVCHRDIKPANVIVTEDGRARLVDFGIAMHDDRTRLSHAGLVPGTPAYLAPEVFGGDPDPRALDVYALGQVLFEALTGRSAFPDPGGLSTTQRIAHVAGAKLRQPALDPGPEHDEDLRRLVRRATDPDPRRRLADLEAFAGALRGELLPEAPAVEPTLGIDLDALSLPPRVDAEDAPLDASEPSLAPHAPPELDRRLLSSAEAVPRREFRPPPPRSWRGPALAGALALVLVLAGVGLAVIRARPAPPPDPPAAEPALRLDGVRVRVVYLPRDRAVADEAIDRLHAAGAMIAPSIEARDRSLMGRVIYWRPGDAEYARIAAQLVDDLAVMTPREATSSTTEPVDLVLWLDVR